MKDETKNEIKSWIVTIVIGLILGIILQVFLQVCIVSGESMMPTLKDGELFLSIKAEWANIDKGDIVAVDSKTLTYLSSDMIVKRIIAEPGDTISITNGVVTVNGEVIEEDYILDKDEERVIVDTIEYTLKDDEYFVMGDNRNNSTDSRYFGPIDKEYIDSVYWFSFYGS